MKISPSFFLVADQYMSRVANWQRLHERNEGNMPLHHGGFVWNTNAVPSDLESDLTCNASASRKRSRRDEPHQMNLTEHEQLLLQQKSAMATVSTATAFRLSPTDFRMNQSSGTSTSGQSTIGHEFPSPMVHIHQQHNDEVEALIRLQSDWLRLELEKKRRQHWNSILCFVDQQVTKRLMEKETELVTVKSRNAELEEKAKQINIENQIWQNAARNAEAVAANLKNTLERLLLQHNGALVEEGYGDSSTVPGAEAAVVDDAGSCCFEGAGEANGALAVQNDEVQKLRMCKSCRGNETSVLLLPCRHLCLCKECDSRLDCCPICSIQKSASLQVYLS